MSQVLVYPDLDSVSRQALQRLEALLQERPGKLTLALSGGSTPKRLYEMMAQSRLPWERLELFWGDERHVPHDHKDSNYRMVREALLDRVSLPADQVHPWPYQESPEASAAAYRELLTRRFGAPDRVAFDVVLLGMGDDGHTASLFPGTQALGETELSAVANRVDKLDTWRLTLTYPVFRRSGQVWFLVCGASKAKVLPQVLAGEDFPSARVECAGGVTFLCDSAAAAALTGPS